MIEQKLRDPVWRRKNRAVTFLSLIPIFGWIGLREMGKRSGQKELRRAGTVIGWVSCIALLLALQGEVIYRLIFEGGISKYSNVVQALIYALRDLPVYGWVMIVATWIAGVVYTMLKSNDYLRYTALREMNMPQRSPWVFDKVWRRKNLLWMIWAALPGLGGLALSYIGYGMQDKKLRRTGNVITILVVLISCFYPIYNRIHGLNYRLWNAIWATINWSALGAWILCLVKSFLVKEQYLDARATQWEADTHRYPLLAQGKWRRVNSRWQTWTYFPFVGGVGIAMAGLRGKNRKHIVKGIVFCVFAAVVLILSSNWRGLFAIVEDRFTWEVAYPTRAGGEDMLGLLRLTLYVLPLHFGTMIRWETLRGRAASLQGYSSEFDRELDMQTRIRARKLDMPEMPVTPVREEVRTETVTAQPEVTVPVREPVIPQTVVPEVSQETVNLNLATQAELMTLPGVGVVQAKQALEYRANHGGFKSVDEFVEVLKIKPHFAVQIFARATVEQAAPVENKTAGESGPVRRRIDF